MKMTFARHLYEMPKKGLDIKYRIAMANIAKKVGDEPGRQVNIFIEG